MSGDIDDMNEQQSSEDGKISAAQPHEAREASSSLTASSEHHPTDLNNNGSPKSYVASEDHVTRRNSEDGGLPEQSDYGPNGIPDGADGDVAGGEGADGDGAGGRPNIAAADGADSDVASSGVASGDAAGGDGAGDKVPRHDENGVVTADLLDYVASYEKLEAEYSAEFSAEKLCSYLRVITKEGAKDKGLLKVNSLDALRECIELYYKSCSTAQDSVDVRAFFDNFFHFLEKMASLKRSFDSTVYTSLYEYYYDALDDVSDDNDSDNDDDDDRPDSAKSSATYLSSRQDSASSRRTTSDITPANLRVDTPVSNENSKIQTSLESKESGDCGNKDNIESGTEAIHGQPEVVASLGDSAPTALSGESHTAETNNNLSSNNSEETEPLSQIPATSENTNALSVQSKDRSVKSSGKPAVSPSSLAQIPPSIAEDTALSGDAGDRRVPSEDSHKPEALTLPGSIGDKSRRMSRKDTVPGTADLSALDAQAIVGRKRKGKRRKKRRRTGPVPIAKSIRALLDETKASTAEALKSKYEALQKLVDTMTPKQRLRYAVSNMTEVSTRWELLLTSSPIPVSAFDDDSHYEIVSFPTIGYFSPILRLVPDLFVKSRKAVDLARMWHREAATSIYVHQPLQRSEDAQLWTQLGEVERAIGVDETEIAQKTNTLNMKRSAMEELLGIVRKLVVMKTGYERAWRTERERIMRYRVLRDELHKTHKAAKARYGAASHPDTDITVQDIETDIELVISELHRIDFELTLKQQDYELEMSMHPDLPGRIAEAKDDIELMERSLAQDEVTKSTRIKVYFQVKENCKRAWDVIKDTRKTDSALEVTRRTLFENSYNPVLDTPIDASPVTTIVISKDPSLADFVLPERERYTPLDVIGTTEDRGTNLSSDSSGTDKSLSESEGIDTEEELEIEMELSRLKSGRDERDEEGPTLGHGQEETEVFPPQAIAYYEVPHQEELLDATEVVIGSTALVLDPTEAKPPVAPASVVGDSKLGSANIMEKDPPPSRSIIQTQQTLTDVTMDDFESATSLSREASIEEISDDTHDEVEGVGSVDTGENPDHVEPESTEHLSENPDQKMDENLRTSQVRMGTVVIESTSTTQQDPLSSELQEGELPNDAKSSSRLGTGDIREAFASFDESDLARLETPVKSPPKDDESDSEHPTMDFPEKVADVSENAPIEEPRALDEKELTSSEIIEKSNDSSLPIVKPKLNDSKHGGVTDPSVYVWRNSPSQVSWSPSQQPTDNPLATPDKYVTTIDGVKTMYVLKKRSETPPTKTVYVLKKSNKKILPPIQPPAPSPAKPKKRHSSSPNKKSRQDDKLSVPKVSAIKRLGDDTGHNKNPASSPAALFNSTNVAYTRLQDTKPLGGAKFSSLPSLKKRKGVTWENEHSALPNPTALDGSPRKKPQQSEPWRDANPNIRYTRLTDKLGPGIKTQRSSSPVQRVLNHSPEKSPGIIPLNYAKMTNQQVGITAVPHVKPVNAGGPMRHTPAVKSLFPPKVSQKR